MSASHPEFAGYTQDRRALKDLFTQSREVARRLQGEVMNSSSEECQYPIAKVGAGRRMFDCPDVGRSQMIRRKLQSCCGFSPRDLSSEQVLRLD